VRVREQSVAPEVTHKLCAAPRVCNTQTYLRKKVTRLESC